MIRKEVSNVNGGRVESYSRTKDESGSLELGEDEVRRIWKYSEDLYNIDTQEEGAVYIWGF